MIKYNVTVKVDRDTQVDWLKWMRTTHIPDVMDTGLFVSYDMSKLLFQDNADGDTFVTQYTCESVEDLNQYFSTNAHRLQKEHNDLFQGKLVAFRTIMELVEEEE